MNTSTELGVENDIASGYDNVGRKGCHTKPAIRRNTTAQV